MAKIHRAYNFVFQKLATHKSRMVGLNGWGWEVEKRVVIVNLFYAVARVPY